MLKPQDGADQRRGDIKVSKYGDTWVLDVVCPGTQHCVNHGGDTTLGLAVQRRPTPRSKRRSTQTASSILEMGGHVNKAAREWLDTLTAPEQGEEVPSQDGYEPRNPDGGCPGEGARPPRRS